MMDRLKGCRFPFEIYQTSILAFDQRRAGAFDGLIAEKAPMLNLRPALRRSVLCDQDS
ncbi:hypothetical protein PO124_15830 [Bacillus licheniformis]|nr:hypothetical protein [Bacillus licheniformis]